MSDRGLGYARDHAYVIEAQLPDGGTWTTMTYEPSAIRSALVPAPAHSSVMVHEFERVGVHNANDWVKRKAYFWP